MIDPKPPKRIKMSRQEWADLRAELLKQCAICGATSNLTAHHILPRSLSGDDVRENLASLCMGPGTNDCHSNVEARRPEALDGLRRSLSQDTIDYLARKKDDGWITRYLPYMQPARPETEDRDDPDQPRSPSPPPLR